MFTTWTVEDVLTFLLAKIEGTRQCQVTRKVALSRRRGEYISVPPPFYLKCKEALPDLSYTPTVSWHSLPGLLKNNIGKALFTVLLFSPQRIRKPLPDFLKEISSLWSGSEPAHVREEFKAFKAFWALGVASILSPHYEFRSKNVNKVPGERGNKHMLGK